MLQLTDNHLQKQEHTKSIQKQSEYMSVYMISRFVTCDNATTAIYWWLSYITQCYLCLVRKARQEQRSGYAHDMT